jgi:hypothetical protein
LISLFILALELVDFAVVEWFLILLGIVVVVNGCPVELLNVAVL